jgi:hypothetical protein
MLERRCNSLGSMRKLTITAVALAAGGAMIAGCGGGSADSGVPPGAKFTKTQAIALANAVNVRAPDVPGLDALSLRRP